MALGPVSTWMGDHRRVGKPSVHLGIITIVIIIIILFFMPSIVGHLIKVPVPDWSRDLSGKM